MSRSHEWLARAPAALCCALALAPHTVSAEEIAPADLGALLAEADRSSAAIMAARLRHEAAGHVPSQRETLPDPMAGIAYTNETLTSLTLGEREDTNLTLSWTQEVPYPGKRRLAGDVARAEIGMAGRRIESIRVVVRSGIKSAYADLHRIDRTLEILAGNRDLLTSLKESARARYENGQAILENVLRSQAELTRIEVEIASLEQERESVTFGLNALVGRRRDAPIGPAVAELRAEAPGPAALDAAILQGAPDLKVLRETVGREEARVELARRELKPDFLWSAAYMYREDLDPMVMGMFGVRLPLFSARKQSRALEEADLERQAVRSDLEDLEIRLLAKGRDLLARAQRADAVMRLYGEGILPQGRSARDAAAAAYTNGQTEFVTVVTDFLAVLRDEIEYENQKAERYRALAALEPLTGQELVRPAQGAEDD